MTWFKRNESEIVASGEKSVRTEGLWIKCEGCRQVVWKAELESNLNVCPKCGQHFRLSAGARIKSLLEPGYELVDLELKSTDPLDFTDLKSYKSRLKKAQEDTGLNDAIINALGQIGPHSQRHGVRFYWR